MGAILLHWGDQGGEAERLTMSETDNPVDGEAGGSEAAGLQKKARAMTAAKDRLWNLCQAAVWVVFREIELVDEFAVADRQAYKALHWYPTMWPEGRQERGQTNELYNALLEGRLIATGIHKKSGGQRRRIPKDAWIDLCLDPPDAFDKRPAHRNEEPWQVILVEGAVVQRLWLAPDTIKSRELYDWPEIKKIHDEVKHEHPEYSQNRTIQEIRFRYEKSVGGTLPSRTAMQSKMKTWR